MAVHRYQWALGSILLFGVAGCSSSNEPKPIAESAKRAQIGTRTIDVEPGIAGGVVEETTQVVAKVSAVDPAQRTVTLVHDAETAAFTVSDEVKNLDQMKVGDTVTATLTQRLVVYVRSLGEKASATYSAALASAPKGAKPGALVAETYEVVADITAIDADSRTATLKFADGSTRQVPVRPDVDLSRYQVGDSLVVRVSSKLSVLTSRP